MIITITNLTTAVVSINSFLGSISAGRTIRKSLAPDELQESISALVKLETEGLLSWQVSRSATTTDDKGEIVPSVAFLGAFTNATRPVLLISWQRVGYAQLPAPGTVWVWNVNDNAYNTWDGTAWRDMMGSLT